MGSEITYHTKKFNHVVKSYKKKLHLTDILRPHVL